MSAIRTSPRETEALDKLGGALRGELLLPASLDYDSGRRIWNGAIDRRPAGIARCAGVADVVAAVRYARERELLVAVRSGGHGVGGHALCDGGLVIDLSPMKGIHVDPQARTARAEAGVLWGELDRETQLFGLATVGGIVSHTGVSGLTLGGGIGWLMRKYGATVDNLLSVDLVTADGELVTASENENPDLFWGVRGGGGNFGVVTSFEFRLHPVGPIVLAGPIFHHLDDAPEVLRFYREFAATAPDELTTIFELELAPPLPFLPEDVHGKPIVMVAACYAGPPEDGAEIVRPLKEFGNPIVDRLEPKPYLALQSMFDPLGAARLAPLLEIGRAAAAHGRCDRHAHRSHLADHVATLVHHRPPARRRARARGRRRDRVRPAGRRAQRRHQRGLDRGRPRSTPAHRLGARPLRRPAAPRARPRLRQLPRRRGTRPRSTGLRHREVRPAGGAQTQVRPHQLLPPQPEHPAVRGLRAGASRGREDPLKPAPRAPEGLRLALRVTSSRAN